MTNITRSSLTVVGAHTTNPQVFWNGILVEGVVGVKIDSSQDTSKVVITVQENPTLLAMQESGITIKRSTNE